MTLGFFQNSDRCYGCKTCSIACSTHHQLTPGNLLRRVRIARPQEGIGEAYLSMACNHCDDPACLSNCPVRAYTKDPETGLVYQDHSRCIGCQTCVEVCPFHAPCYNPDDATTYKCDGCIDRYRAGLKPVCVNSCPSLNICLETLEHIGQEHPEGLSLKEIASQDKFASSLPTLPNYTVQLDKDWSQDIFLNIDGSELVFDRGGERY